MADAVPTGVQKYLQAISTYEREFERWQKRATKIIKRYRDDMRTQSGNETVKFNILWSNVQTLIPAVYAKLPKASAARRFGDNDQVGRVAAQLIERALDYEIEHYPDFRATMRYAVEDRFLGGRGVAWVRYEPHVRAQELAMPEDGTQVTEDVDEDGNEAETPEEIEYECAPVDYVHWKDFGHSSARTWEEVTQVWRWVYMTREALVERFGEEMGRKIPLDSGPDNLDGPNRQREGTRAKICELWCKETQKVYWLHKGMSQFVDERDDPLGLENFFPCPRPLYATTTSDSLVPVPDFLLYQDQANELDILSDRIDGLVKALRMRGVYDASQPALQRLLTEGDNNALIPVDKWMAFGEKGGLKGSIDLLPLDTLAQALLQCYAAREQIKAQIYEITGISDIIRGQTAASETATAQQIKGQYAGLRLRSMQEEVALFASELIRLKAQIICQLFQPQTILQYAAAQQMSPEDQQMIPQALQLLADKPLRNFRVEVASDSLVQIDEAQNKQDRLEFVQAYGGFLEKALPVVQQVPQVAPIVVELMKYGIGAFKQAEAIEGTLDRMLEEITQQQQAQAGAPPPPDPEMVKAQMQQQAEAARMQAEQQKAQFDAQMQQAKLQADMQIEQMKAQAQAAIEEQRQRFEAALKAEEMTQRAELERHKAQVDAETKIMVARIGAAGVDVPGLDLVSEASSRLATGMSEDVRALIQTMAQDSAGREQRLLAMMQALMQAMAAPKRIVRGPDGRAMGVEVERLQ
jgi:F0F1-type ATP synthase membrane subunit b/b'